jgi:NADH-quinone oxidoreductase subunit A
MSYTAVLIFFLAGAAFVVAALLASRLLAPHKPNPVKNSTYECGEEPVGTPWIRFNTRFYVIALIFLVFDVEVLFLFPWALNLKKLGLFAWVDMAVFIAILAAGLAYVWGKGDLDWVRPKGSSAGASSVRSQARRVGAAGAPVRAEGR